MIIRLTQKLAKKIKIAPATVLPPHDNPFLDWTANLFRVAGYHLIILTNSHCLYSVLLVGRGITSETTFAEKALKSLYEYMTFDHTAFLFDTHIAPQMDSVKFSKTGNRSVLGSMNDLIHTARVYLLENGLPLSFVSSRLNQMPMSNLEFHNPREQLLALADQSNSLP